MTHLRVIDTIQIASPCDADWGAMTGNTRVKHCGACEKNVYNLSAMTEDQIYRLIDATEGQFCGRLYRRADGTMLTADCPVGLKEKMKRAARRTWLIAAAFVTALLGGAGLMAAKTVTDNNVMGGIEPIEMPMGEIEIDPQTVPPDVTELKGDVALPEELQPVKRPVKMGKIKYTPRAEMGGVSENHARRR